MNEAPDGFAATLAMLTFCAVGLAAMPVDCPTTPNAVGDGVMIVDASSVIESSGGIPGAFGALIYSPVEVAPMPFGHGTLCVQPFVPGAGRTPVAAFDADGLAEFAVPPVAPGSTVHVQLWYRDSDGVGNTSNSIAIDGDEL